MVGGIFVGTCKRGRDHNMTKEARGAGEGQAPFLYNLQ
jgi:hypothetical protein